MEKNAQIVNKRVFYLLLLNHICVSRKQKYRSIVNIKRKRTTARRHYVSSKTFDLIRNKKVDLLFINLLCILHMSRILYIYIKHFIYTTLERRLALSMSSVLSRKKPKNKLAINLWRLIYRLKDNFGV